MVKYRFLQGTDEQDIVTKLNRAVRVGYDEIVYFYKYPEGHSPFAVIVRGKIDEDEESEP